MFTDGRVWTLVLVQTFVRAQKLALVVLGVWRVEGAEVVPMVVMRSFQCLYKFSSLLTSPHRVTFIKVSLPMGKVG